MKRIFLVLLVAAAAHAAEFSTGQAARLVIGQRTFTEQEPGAREDLVGGVSGLAYAGDMLFVVDSNRIGASPQNERVLIYKNLSGKLPSPTDELYFDRPCPVCRGSADVVLGQADFSTTDIALTQKGLRTPTAVATDGRIVAVADTDNNRVLIWRSIPATNGVPADVVVGQPDFTKGSIPGNVPNNKSMRGPQGVWIQNGKMFVADTQNHRILIYNSIPTANGAAADVVLGQPDFGTFVEPDLTRATADTNASNLINPVAVTSDGIRLYVADLGHNRVLIWNSIPTRNQTAADVVVGQPDTTSAIANNSAKLCPSNGTDSTTNTPTYPPFCEATMDFPRFALSDGRRLFIADGGNDRVLIYNHIPTNNGEAADAVIGQLGGGINQASDSTDSMRTPMSLAWDGTNLYVSDSFNRRVMVYTVAEHNVPYSGVRNAASRDIFAVGGVALSGTIKADDEVTIKVDPTEYKYKILKDDTFDIVVAALVKAINGSNSGKGDPNVLATPNVATQSLILTSRIPGADGNNIAFSTSVSTTAVIVATTSGASLSGGQDAAKIAPGTIVAVLGDGLSEGTASARADQEELPTTLADTQVYFDGIRASLVMVTPTEITAQIPFEVVDRTSISAYVRTKRKDGSVVVTTPVAVTIVAQNPGIFALPGSDPRQAIAMHGSASASGTVSVDGSVTAGNIGTVVIEDREYSYTVTADDTLATVRDHLIDAINQDPKVLAFAAGSFTRIRLRARTPGPEGNGIQFSAKSNDGSTLILTPLNIGLCCANSGMVTYDNPAVAGETIIVYATGLGIPIPRVEATGIRYRGGITDPNSFVSSLAGGKTANVLLASFQTGQVGVYEVHLELNSDLPTDPLAQLTIAQDIYVSNIVTIPVVNPNPPAAQ